MRAGTTGPERGATLALLGPLLLGLAQLLGPPALAQDPRDRDYAVDRGGVLYAVDCEQASFQRLGRIEVPAPAGGDPERPVLCDLAATPDGHLYGISTTTLYLINLERPEASRRIGAHGLDAPYGMGCDGTDLVVNTLGGEVHVLDPETAKPRLKGPMGGPFVASGDLGLVGERLLSSVKDGSRREHLVELDRKTGKARAIGLVRDPQGRPLSDLFGLIERKGVLYGLLAGGALVRIEPDTGRCVVLRETGITWWGATSYTRF